jgi:copper chaperone NosL
MKPVYALLGLLTLIVTGCDQKTAQNVPPPREITDEAIGHYCGMALAEHAGPKGQIFLASRKDPVWFSSVHDTIAFTLLPEEPKNIAVIYVTDIGKAKKLDSPEPGTWIEAKKAWFVIESGRTGGMGGAELVPFSQEADAKDFATREGGRVVRFGQIPRDYVLAEGPAPAARGEQSGAPHGGHPGTQAPHEAPAHQH